MAGWNDLPLELKQVIVDSVDSNPFPFKYMSPRPTLYALMLVSREVSAIASPRFWEYLNCRHLEEEDAPQLIDEILPSRGHLVRELDASVPMSGSEQHYIESMSKVLEVTPNLKDLVISESTALLAWRLSDVQRERITGLALHGQATPEDDQPARYAAALLALPNLQELSLFAIADNCTPLLISLLKDLQHMKRLSLKFVKGLHHPSINAGWKAALDHLSITTSTDQLDLRPWQMGAFTLQFATTLRSIELIILDTLYSSAEDAVFVLPHLTEIVLCLPALLSPLCLAFDSSPVQHFDVTINHYLFRSPEAVKLRMVEKYGATLKSISFTEINRQGDTKSLLEEADIVQAACDRKGIDYCVTLV